MADEGPESRREPEAAGVPIDALRCSFCRDSDGIDLLRAERAGVSGDKGGHRLLPTARLGPDRIHNRPIETLNRYVRKPTKTCGTPVSEKHKLTVLPPSDP